MTSEVVSDLASFDLIGAWNTYWEKAGARRFPPETGSVDPGGQAEPPTSGPMVPNMSRVSGSGLRRPTSFSRMHLALRSRRPRRSNRARQSPASRRRQAGGSPTAADESAQSGESPGPDDRPRARRRSQRDARPKTHSRTGGGESSQRWRLVTARLGAARKPAEGRRGNWWGALSGAPAQAFVRQAEFPACGCRPKRNTPFALWHNWRR